MYRLFVFALCFFIFSFSLFAMKTAALTSSFCELYQLAGGKVDIAVTESVERGFVLQEDVVLVDQKAGVTIDQELLLAAKPDLVLLSQTIPSHVRLARLLERFQIETMAINIDSFEDFLAVYYTLCEKNGRLDLYETYGKGQQNAIEDLKASLPALSRAPKVLFIRTGSGLSSCKAKRSDEHFAANILSELGAVNVADGGRLSADLSMEVLLMENPDQIFVVTQGDEEASLAYIQSLFQSAPWQRLEAIKEHRVTYLDRELFHFKPNQNWLDAYCVMAKALYET